MNKKIYIDDIDEMVHTRAERIYRSYNSTDEQLLMASIAEILNDIRLRMQDHRSVILKHETVTKVGACLPTDTKPGKLKNETVGKRTMSINEVLKRYGISRPTAYRWIQEPGAPVIRTGKRILIPIKEFDEWVLSHNGGNILPEGTNGGRGV